MSFSRCIKCNKLFEGKYEVTCPSCKEDELNNLNKIYDYFHETENPTKKLTNIDLISDETGVDIHEIERLYRANKLRGFTGRFEINCKICGKKFKPSMSSGVCCFNCAQKIEVLIHDLKEEAKYSNKSQEPQSPKSSNSSFKTKSDSDNGS